MNENNAVFAYHQINARGATAVGQVVALYDTILRDFRRAIAAIDVGNIEVRVAELNHALTIIGELQGVLDFQRGGDAAKNFDAFYTVTRRVVLQASIRNSRQNILELIEMFSSVRQAWHEADKTLSPVEPKRILPTTLSQSTGALIPPSGQIDESPTVPGGNWNA